MAFRGYFALNGLEFANSSRAIAHLGVGTPTSDVGIFAPPEGTPCSLVETEDEGLFEIPEDAIQYDDLLWYPPNGSRRVGPGLYEIDGTCWGPSASCVACSTTMVTYDDSWPGLQEFLGDTIYRPELAPWYTVELPESAEFGGIWVMGVTGLGPTPINRPVTQMTGSGGAAGQHRDRTRTVSFDALLFACTNAGLEFGLNWLACLMRDTSTNTDSTLRYLAASPAHSGVDPATLVREVHNVVLTSEPRVTEQYVQGNKDNQHATMYRVSWELTTLSPYAYLPEVVVPVEWDEITRQPVNWIHAADCAKPETCEEMPILFSTDCVPEEIDIVSSPPPVCGGCLPVGEIDKYSFRVPTMEYPFRCRETAVSLTIVNTGEKSLTFQGFWRVCGSDVRCEDNRYPVQITGLPPTASLTLDGITGRYQVYYDERIRRPIGIVGTPTGAPWRPPIIDRHTCWDFIVQTSAASEFEITMTLADREP